MKQDNLDILINEYLSEMPEPFKSHLEKELNYNPEFNEDFRNSFEQIAYAISSIMLGQEKEMKEFYKNFHKQTFHPLIREMHLYYVGGIDYDKQMQMDFAKDFNLDPAELEGRVKTAKDYIVHNNQTASN